MVTKATLKKNIADPVAGLVSPAFREGFLKVMARTPSVITEMIPDAASAAIPRKRKRTRDTIKFVATDITQGVGIIAILAFVVRFFARRMRNGG